MGNNSEIKGYYRNNHNRFKSRITETSNEHIKSNSSLLTDTNAL